MAFKAWLLAVVGLSLVFVFQAFYPLWIGPLSNLFSPACACTAFVSSFLCVRRYGSNPRRRFEAVWFCFALGMGTWFLAEVTWALYYFVLNVPVPYPSIADVFYIGAYFPLFTALALYFKVFSASMSRRRLALSIGIIACSVALVVGIVRPAEVASDESMSNVITDLLYPLLDLSLLSLTILSLAIFIGGAIRNWWLLLGGAITLAVVADELFLIQVSAGIYYNGDFDDLLYLVGYLTFALAFYVHRREF